MTLEIVVQNAHDIKVTLNTFLRGTLMSDAEIKKYLKENNNTIKAQDCIMEILNTSCQIIDNNYDFETKTMTIKTPDNTFTFKLTLL